MLNRRSIISLLIGTLLSGITLYLAFRKVPFSDLIDYFYNIHFVWIIPSVLFVLISFVLRTIRWQLILSETHQVSFWRAFHPLMAGFMMNCIMPGRIGELARPALLQKRDNIPFSSVLATVAAERLFDIILLVVLFIVIINTINIDPGLTITTLGYQVDSETLVRLGKNMGFLSILLIAGIILILNLRVRSLIIRLITAFPSIMFFISKNTIKKIRNEISGKAVLALNNLAASLKIITNPLKVSCCFILTVIIWLVQAYSYYLFAKGCPGIEISFIEISAVMIIICFFIALPSVPGFWGLWEAGGIFALSLFSIEAGHAAGFTLANHAIQMLPVVIVGLISALHMGAKLTGLSFKKQTEV